MKEFPISQITVQRNRFRKDLGNIDELAADIEQNGLYHPVLIDHKGNLIAGLRRLEACKKIGWRTIPVKVITTDDTKTIEINENLKRKDFTEEEKAEIQRYLIEKYSDQTNQGQRNDLVNPKVSTYEKTFSQVKRTTQKVGEIFGESHKQVEKRKEIFEAIEKNPKKFEHVKKGLAKSGSTKMSINTAYQIITREKRSKPQFRPAKGTFDAMMEDAPFEFDRGAGARGSSAKHYDTLPLQEIIDMRMPLADNAVVGEWISTSMKYDTQTVRIDGAQFTGSTLNCLLKARGLTAFDEIILPKAKPGMGSTTFSMHETLVLAHRGTKKPVAAKRFPSVLPVYDGEHSEKPAIAYERFREMFPGRKYYAPFEREQRKGFVCGGNELEDLKA